MRIFPCRAAEFASYTPKELITGFDPMSEPLRCEPATMMDAIEFAASILLRNEHALETLPMLSLYQYIAKDIIKDATAYANACVLKGRACAAAGFISEGLDLLLEVYAGRGLPDIVPLERPPAGQQVGAMSLYFGRYFSGSLSICSDFTSLLSTL